MEEAFAKLFPVYIWSDERSEESRIANKRKLIFRHSICIRNIVPLQYQFLKATAAIKTVMLIGCESFTLSDSKYVEFRLAIGWRWIALGSKLVFFLFFMLQLLLTRAPKHFEGLQETPLVVTVVLQKSTDTIDWCPVILNRTSILQHC